MVRPEGDAYDEKPDDEYERPRFLAHGIVLRNRLNRTGEASSPFIGFPHWHCSVLVVDVKTRFPVFVERFGMNVCPAPGGWAEESGRPSYIRTSWVFVREVAAANIPLVDKASFAGMALTRMY